MTTSIDFLPNMTRSTNPEDYQRLPQAIGAMAKQFADGHEIALHHHARDQLLFAVQGTMGMRTAQRAWIVPPGGAVYIPATTPHAVVMHGAVDMRTLYLDPARRLADGPPALRVIAVSPLLRELILALSEAPMAYPPESRAGKIADLIGLEMAAAGVLPLDIPLPRDPRLRRLCGAVIASPGDDKTLEAWSATAGASARTLARLCRRELGMGFRQWRQRVRFHSALEALGRGEAVARVAAAHGYRSASAFTAAFGATMGAPPSRFVGVDGGG